MSDNQTLEEKFQTFNNTSDTTDQFDPQDIQNNKVMAALSYFGILVLIPILAAKDSKFARFHANQGLIFLIACIILSVANAILSSVIIGISWRLYWLSSIISLIVGLVCLIFFIIGIINVVNGRAKELPVIGHYKLLAV